MTTFSASHSNINASGDITLRYMNVEYFELNNLAAKL